VALCAGTAWPILQADDNSSVAGPEAQAFRRLDQDSNGTLSVDEFVAGRQPASLYRRDFQLFDFDADGKMTLEEYLPISRGVEFPLRGPIPDPLQKLVDKTVATVDQKFRNWSERPNEEVGTAHFIQVMATGPKEILAAINAGDVDENGDGRVSRAEVRQFLEIQLGVRHRNGQPLRVPSGAINRYFTFFMLDTNNNDHLERVEYLGHVARGEKEAEEFQFADRDKDSKLSFAEWRRLDWTFVDPISEFRRMDANFDALPNPDELAKNSPPSKQRLVKHLIPAFDLNNDHQLSLEEFRLCPHTNPIVTWMSGIRDIDHDQKLSLKEFIIDEPSFPLLRLVYFLRFDQNGDGFLDPTEFEFKIDPPGFIYSISEDGTDLRKLDLGHKTYYRLGSTSVSPDGEWLAFDAMPRFESATPERKILVVPLEGGDAQEVCTGMMPSWSPDSQQVICSLAAPQSGSWILRLFEGDSTYIGNGWGAEWSPDGKKIYFYSGRTMQLYDVQTKQTEILVDASEHEYKSFEWNSSWSPNSQRICVKAESPDGGYDIVIVNLAAKGKDRMKSRFSAKKMSGEFAWHPFQRRVVNVLYDVEQERELVHEFDPDTDDQPKVMKGKFPNSRGGFSWTPDGKRLFFCSSDP